MYGTRYSGTRMEGARNTACTKLTDEDKEALHLLAVEAGMSDYELTREILIQYITHEYAQKLRDMQCGAGATGDTHTIYHA